MLSPAYGPGFPGSPDLCPLLLSLLQSLDKYLLSITMYQAFPRGQKNYSENNTIFLCPSLKCWCSPRFCPPPLFYIVSLNCLFTCVVSFSSSTLLLMIHKDPASPYHTSSAEYSKGTVNSMHSESNSIASFFFFQHSLHRSSPPYSSSHAF